MRKVIRSLLMMISGVYFFTSLAFAVFVWRSELTEIPLLIMHLSLFALGLLVVPFLQPYEMWLWNKPGKLEKAILAALIMCAFLSWLLGALCFSWAKIEFFFAFIYAAVSFSLFCALWHLPRVRKFNLS